MAIARPDSTSASASAIRNASSSMPSSRCTIEVAAVRANVTATPSTVSPRTRSARRQSAIADRLETDVADPAAAQRGVAAAHVVEVDHHRDRHLHAVGALAPVVLERGHGGGEAVVREAGRDGDHRQPAEARRVLGEVQGAAAADADQRVVEPLAQPPRQQRGLLDAAALGGPDLGVLEAVADLLGDLLAEAGPDHDGDVPAAGDPAVGQQRREAVDRP